MVTPARVAFLPHHGAYSTKPAVMFLPACGGLGNGGSPHKPSGGVHAGSWWASPVARKRHPPSEDGGGGLAASLWDFPGVRK